MGSIRTCQGEFQFGTLDDGLIAVHRGDMFAGAAATGETLSIKTVLNGQERQNYPVADMFFPPHQLVAAVSRDMTLMPGDIIACGTSLGAGVMRDAQNTVDIVIEGVDTLSNRFDRQTAA